MLDFTLDELEVTNQADLDSIPVDYNGRIIIKFGKPWDRAVVRRRYPRSVVARGNSSVVAWENSSVVAWGNSSVEARGNSSVVAWENSSVVAWGNSSVVAWENSSVVAWGNSSVEARGNSSVVAWENSSVVAWENSSVDLDGYAQATKYQHASCTAKGHSRVIEPTKDINTFIAFYSVKHTKTRSTWYKAVHKRDGRYVAEHNDFEYIIGKTATNNCDPDRSKDCSYGLHIATLRWALDFGREWPDLAILEVNVKTADIIVPYNSDGKVRVPELKVVREVPLDECGIFGKMLARKNQGA